MLQIVFSSYSFPPNLTYMFLLYPTFAQKKSIYLFLYSNLMVSAINAMNSELVGLPFPLLTVYPNRSSSVSSFPLLHATSMAWRIARSTRLAVV